MSVGSLQGCVSTLSEIMQENRLQQSHAPVDSNLASSNSTQNSRLDVEPASIDVSSTEAVSSIKQASPTNSVTATEPISNLTIEVILASNKSTTNNYQVNGQQDQSNLTPGLLIDIKT